MSRQVTEYAVRTIDRFGDVVDVNHYKRGEAMAEAERAMQHLSADEVAVVVEKEVSRWGEGDPESGDSPDSIDRLVLATLGDRAALEAGEWVVGGQS